MNSSPLGFGIPLTWQRNNQVIQNNLTTATPLIVQGMSGQTADVFDVKNSAGTVLFGVDNSGNLTIAGTATVSINSVTGNLSVGGNLSVTGTSSLTGAVSLATTLSVTGTSSFTGLVTVNDLNSLGTITANNLTAQSFTLGGFTSGSIIFAGAGGQFSQNNANFNWANSTKILTVNGQYVSTLTTTNTSGNFKQLSMLLSAAPATNTNTSYYGLSFTVNDTGAVGNITAGGNLTGLRGGVLAAAAITIAEMEGIIAEADFNGATITAGYALKTVMSFTAGTTTTAIGVYIPAYANGGGTITTSYGLKVDSPGMGSTQFTAAIGTGNSYVAGTLNIGSAASTTSSFAITQPVATSGTPIAFTITGGAHTGLTNAEDNDVLFSLGRTVQFTGGGGSFNQNTIRINPVTYSAAAAQTIGFSSTVYLGGGPLQGTNVTLGSLVTSVYLDTWGTQGGTGVTCNNMFIVPPGIANSIGNISAISGILVSTAGSNISLGDQTATLTTLSSIRAGGNTFVSTTNTRTVTTASQFSSGGFHVPSTNVTFTNNYQLHLSSAGSGTPIGTAFRIDGVAFTALTASVENTDVTWNFNRIVTFATGALSVQRAVLIASPTYAFAGASNLTTAGTFAILGMPVNGTNATIANAIAFSIGSVASYATSLMVSVYINQPIISNGSGAVTSLYGLAMDGSAVSLGNQTSTLTTLASIQIPSISYTSTTLTRTVTNAASLLIAGAPSNGGNVTFTNGPYSLLVQAGISYFQGRINPNKGANVSSANNLTLGTDGNVFNITGTTQVNLIDNSSWTAGAIVVLYFAGALTVKQNQAASGNFKPILLSASADLTTAANTVLVLFYDGTNWQEMSRKAA